jgi:hypothetical protein
MIATDIDPNTLSNNKCGSSVNPHHNTSNVICPDLYRNVTEPVGPKAMPKDWTNAGILLASMMVIAYLCLICLFRPDYKRTRFEIETKKSDDKNNTSFLISLEILYYKLLLSLTK